jgi:hypothetical protein
MKFAPNWRTLIVPRQGVTMLEAKDRCIVLDGRSPYYEDDGWKLHYREPIHNWIEDLNESSPTEWIALPNHRYAFVFEDPVYMKLFMMHFNIEFKWE